MSFKIGQTVKFGNLPTIGRVQMSNGSSYGTMAINAL